MERLVCKFAREHIGLYSTSTRIILRPVWQLSAPQLRAGAERAAACFLGVAEGSLRALHGVG